MDVVFYLLIVACNSTASVFTKKNAAGGGKTLKFNAARAVVPLVIFGAVALASGEILTPKTALFGALYGLSLAGSTICGYLALSIGPMGVTSAIAASSLVPVTLWCALVRNETLTPLKIVGVSLALVALVVMNVEKPIGGFNKKKWLALAFSTLALNAVGQILVVSCESGSGGVGFTALAQVVPTVLFGGAFLLAKIKKRGAEGRDGGETENESGGRKIGLRSVVLGAVAGVATASSALVTFILSARESGAVLFPIVSALNIVAVFVLGITVFKEKPTVKRVIAVILAAVAVAVLKIV